jgi:hypothetical protein
VFWVLFLTGFVFLFVFGWVWGVFLTLVMYSEGDLMGVFWVVVVKFEQHFF